MHREVISEDSLACSYITQQICKKWKSADHEVPLSLDYSCHPYSKIMWLTEIITITLKGRSSGSCFYVHCIFDHDIENNCHGT